MCKELRTPPRGGGLLDQPAHELVLLEKTFDAIAKDQERRSERDKMRAKNRERHTVPTSSGSS